MFNTFIDDWTALKSKNIPLNSQMSRGMIFFLFLIEIVHLRGNRKDLV